MSSLPYDLRYVYIPIYIEVGINIVFLLLRKREVSFINSISIAILVSV